MRNWVDKKLTAMIRKRQLRAYDAGKPTRTSNGWATTRKSSDSDVRPALQRMVAVSRHLAQNNDYIKKYLRLLETNAIGQDGIKLQMRVKGLDGKNDKEANALIEKAWLKWGRKEFCCVTGGLTWNDYCKLFVKTVAIDGELLSHKVTGFDNPFGFALQMIETDYLDEQFNLSARNQNEIRMGIEVDQWRKPVTYYILTNHPGDDSISFNGRRYQPISASRIIHSYTSDRPQMRGVPWVHSAAKSLGLLDGYSEAALVGAEAGASQMGVIYSPDGDPQGVGDGEVDGKIEMAVEPGVWRSIPIGYDFKQFDPKQPTGEYGPFMKTNLRAVASGIGVSYNSLGSDAETVNFSSLRHFTLEDRDNWRMVQAFVIDHLCTDVFESWLRMALTTQAIPLPLARFDDFNKPAWRPRAWQWVDPVKDIKATIIEINAGLNSRTRVAAEQGRELEEVFDELEAEEQMAEARKLKLSEDSDTGHVEEPEEEEITNEEDDQNRKTLSVV